MAAFQITRNDGTTIEVRAELGGVDIGVLPVERGEDFLVVSDEDGHALHAERASNIISIARLV